MKKIRCILSIVLSAVMFFSTVGGICAFAQNMNNGWNEDKTKYYVNNAPVTSNFAEIDGALYYFNSDSKRITGWKTYKGRKYYFYTEGEKIGTAADGRVTIDGDVYFFEGNKMVTGWKSYDGYRYYFYKKGKKKGKAATGLVKINNHTYLFSKNGKMKVGWKKYDGEKYFFYKSGKKKGKAATGKVKIGKKNYSFSKDGKLNGRVYTMAEKAYNYSSPTKYLILVNKKSHKVAIYKGKKHNWKRIKYWDCTVGAPGTRTPSGNFLIGPSGGKPFHQRYFDSGRVRCWWATRITGGYNFHSVLYTQASKPVHVFNGRLGADLSHGCVRLKIQNAKWLYNNVPSKTRCIIY